MLDRSAEKTFWYFDENGMLLEHLGWSDGKGDSLGRNAFAYICYPNDSLLREAIHRCIKVRDDSFVQFYRYPDHGADTISRDHIGAVICALYINRDWDDLDFILDNLPWRLSRKYRQTIDFWLWHRALRYRAAWHRSVWVNLFLVLTLVQMLLIVPWNAIIRWIIGQRKIDPAVFKYSAPPAWKKQLHRLQYPQFALFLLAWQIRVLPESYWKSVIGDLASIESGNIVIDNLLKGSPIDRSKYSPTTSFIWARRIDNFDDVLLRPMTEEESGANDLNRSMLDYLYFGIDRIMLAFPDEIVRSIKTKKEVICY